MHSANVCVIYWSMAVKLALLAVLCVLLPAARAGAQGSLEGASEAVAASVSRSGHIAWNTGCWLLALAFMAWSHVRQGRSSVALESGHFSKMVLPRGPRSSARV